MRKWDPLNPRQLEVLTRVASGEDVSSDPSAKTSARALQNRGLITVSRRGGGWKAEITDTGRFYLENGHHPEHPDRRPLSKPEARNDQPKDRARSATRKPPRATARIAAARRQDAADLVAELEDKGHVVISRPDEDGVSTWRKVVDFAKRHDMVPPGHLISRYRIYNGDLKIDLVKGPHPNAKPAHDPELRIDVPDVVDQLHPLLAHLSDPAAVLQVSEEQTPRALRIMHTLLTEADHRGYETGWAEDTERGAEIRTKELRLVVTMSEEQDKRDVLPTASELAKTKVYEWQRFQPDTRFVPSGRLRLEVGTQRSCYNRGQWWADRKRWRLEDKIGEVIATIDARIQAERDRLLEEERARLQRQRDWEAAMDRARQRFHEDRRIKALTEQLADWETAAKIREYCAALESAPATDKDDVEQAQWREWCRAYADRIDPTKHGAANPEEIEPDPSDLNPYLGRWSPYGP